MTKQTAYRAACLDATVKRAKLQSSFQDAQQRIAPARLKQDVKAKASATLRNGMMSILTKVQQRPVATGAAAGAFLLFLARRPVKALFTRSYVKIRNRNSESDDA